MQIYKKIKTIPYLCGHEKSDILSGADIVLRMWQDH